MKRKVFSIMALAAIALVSCKKDNVDDTALGTATISGTITGDIDQTNDINGGGLYEAGLNPEGVEGMGVRVVVNTMKWDKDPVSGYGYDKMTYTTTTDVNGDFTISFPAVDEEFTVDLRFDDKYGITRSLYTTDGTTSTEEVYAHYNQQNISVYSGAMVELYYDANLTAVNTSTDEYGTATIHGDVNMTWDNTTWNGIPANQKLTSASGQGTQEVLWYYETAPHGNGMGQEYTVTVDAAGHYELTITTEGLTETDVVIDFGMFDFIGTRLINNQAATADSSQAVEWSCGGVDGVNNLSVGAGDIIIQDLTMTANPL